MEIRRLGNSALGVKHFHSTLPGEEVESPPGSLGAQVPQTALRSVGRIRFQSLISVEYSSCAEDFACKVKT